MSNIFALLPSVMWSDRDCWRAALAEKKISRNNHTGKSRHAGKSISHLSMEKKRKQNLTNKRHLPNTRRRRKKKKLGTAGQRRNPSIFLANAAVDTAMLVC